MFIQLSQKLGYSESFKLRPAKTNKELQTNQQIHHRDNADARKKKYYALGSAALVTAGVAIGYFVKNKKSVKVLNPSNQPLEQKVVSPLVQELKTRYEKLIQKFPQDEVYYKTLAKGISLNEGEEYKLASITGSSQLTEILQKATAQDFAIGENLLGVKNRTLRINLHNHTTASDGKLTPAQMLEQARKWANEVVAVHGNDGKSPFVIGFTDHDCVDGAKEVVKLIAENPEKYQNLKVVLGGEFSVSYTNPTDVKSPLNFELIGYGLNPFSENISTCLQGIKMSRAQKVLEYINIIQKRFPQYNLEFKDIEGFHSNLHNMRTNGVLYLTKDCLMHKMYLTEYVEKINTKILPPEAEKIDATELFRSLKDKFYVIKDAEGYRGNPIATFYKDSVLKPMLKEKGYLNKTNQNKFSAIFRTKLDEQEKFLKEVLNEMLPKVDDKSGYIIRPNEWFNVVKEADSQMFFGIAHPGLVNVSMYSDDVVRVCRENGYDNGQHLAWRLYSSLKKDGGDLFRATEANYQSYGSKDASSLYWQKYMGEDKANEFNLLKTGGIDCHKPSIFKKHTELTQQEIVENNLIGIL